MKTFSPSRENPTSQTRFRSSYSSDAQTTAAPAAADHRDVGHLDRRAVDVSRRAPHDVRPTSEPRREEVVAQPQDAGTPRGGVRLDKTWLLVPLGVMALVVLLPLGHVTVLWIQYRRAEGAYTRDP
jgi:hypothetical protein